MAEPIYTLVTSDDVLDYLINHIDLIDDDDSMTDEELDKAIADIVAKSTEGRLHEMLRERLAWSWISEKVFDMVDDCMYDFVAECLGAK